MTNKEVILFCFLKAQCEKSAFDLQIKKYSLPFKMKVKCINWTNSSKNLLKILQAIENIIYDEQVSLSPFLNKFKKKSIKFVYGHDELSIS